MSDKQIEALKLAQDLKALADKFSEGWHEGIKIDASDIVLLSDAAEALAEQPAQQKPACKQNLQVWVISNGKGRGQFSWEPQDERYWTRMEPAIKQDLTPEQPAQQQSAERVEPYGWKVYGVNSLFMGEFAEADAKAEAKRIGGTCIAFPLYTSPQPAQQKPVPDALHFAQWTAAKKDLSDYILVGSLSLAGIEDGEYGTPEINPFDNTIKALQEKLITGSDRKKVPLLAYIGALNNTSPQPSKPWVGLTQQDIDIAFDDTQEGGGFDEFARAIEAKLREKNAQPSKPLTQEHIERIFLRYGGDMMNCARAIEREHGIKGDA